MPLVEITWLITSSFTAVELPYFIKISVIDSEGVVNRPASNSQSSPYRQNQPLVLSGLVISFVFDMVKLNFKLW
jgi:hypothetical protein